MNFGLSIILLSLLFKSQFVFAHHDGVGEPWRFYHHGIFRAFFSGFFSTLFLIIGVLVFYYYCFRGGAVNRFFPIFPKKPIIPVTIPFARVPNYLGSDHPETIVLTSATSTPPSVFYSNAPGGYGDTPAGSGKGGYSAYVNVL